MKGIITISVHFIHNETGEIDVLIEHDVPERNTLIKDANHRTFNTDELLRMVGSTKLFLNNFIIGEQCIFFLL